MKERKSTAKARPAKKCQPVLPDKWLDPEDGMPSTPFVPGGCKDGPALLDRLRLLLDSLRSSREKLQAIALVVPTWAEMGDQGVPPCDTTLAGYLDTCMDEARRVLALSCGLSAALGE